MLLPFLLALSTSRAAPAQPAPMPPPVVEADQPPATDAPAEAEPPPIPPKKPPLGWLSDPDKPAEDLFDAFVSGKIHFDNNFRVELADTTGRDSSTAITNRIRLGYETKAYRGFSGMVEMENVATPDLDNYFVPGTGEGTPTRTAVSDPPGTEMNQAWVRYRTESLPGARMSLDVKGGRQRIKLDDERFIGNVGWRQFEQTLDSISAESDFGVDGLSVFYAYVWRVQRISGPDGLNPDSDSHLIHASYEVMPELKVTPFAYLLDFEEDEPLNSVDSYGVRFTGDVLLGGPVLFDYELTYAHQTDAGQNPVDFEADFFAAQLRLTRKDFGFAILGYQLLGSDDGRFGFRFPLGTNHAFQGFADEFLVTPATGVQDLYMTGGLDLPYGVKSFVRFHQFWSDEGGVDLGNEIDFVAAKKITPNWSALIKGAFFNGHNGLPDTTRFWIQTTISF